MAFRRLCWIAVIALTSLSFVVFMLVVWSAQKSGTAWVSAAPVAGGESQVGRPLGTEDGLLPDDGSASVFDDDLPAIAKLDSELLAALREAATEAEEDGVPFAINSAWRSPGYQQKLLDDAVTTYGSRAEAAKWVATPETSLHVSGDAVDIGNYDALDWLSRFGSQHGLCQIYSNEPWHFELRPSATKAGCPERYADPTQDPRLS